VAAVIGGVAWLVKVALIWANGGTNTDEGVVGLAYLVGLVGVVVAVGALGWLLTRGRPVWLRAVATIVFPVVVFVGWQLLDGLIKAVYTEENWVQGEITIVIAALVALGVGGSALVRSGRRPAGRHVRSRADQA
jgi:hypothetical protein